MSYPFYARKATFLAHEFIGPFRKYNEIDIVLVVGGESNYFTTAYVNLPYVPQISISEYSNGNPELVDDDMFETKLYPSVASPFKSKVSDQVYRVVILNVKYKNFVHMLEYAKRLYTYHSYDKLYVVRPIAVTNELLQPYEINSLINSQKPLLSKQLVDLIRNFTSK